MRNLYLLIFPRTAKILQIMRFFMIPESCISQNNFSHAKCEITPGKTKGSRDGIWEMQSPQGDGNSSDLNFLHIHALFEKCSPRKGTETFLHSNMELLWRKDLRNAVPARGRKLVIYILFLHIITIWEMQSPWGDGNKKRTRGQSVDYGFEKCSPREGTETLCSFLPPVFNCSDLRNAVPVRGRKRFSYSLP